MPDRAEAITSFVVKSLKAVGLMVEVEVEEDRAAYARRVGLEKKIGHMALFDSSSQSTFRVLDDKTSSETKAFWWQGYQDAAVDDLIKVASCAVEHEDREEAYSVCLKRLRENPPWLYLVHQGEVFAARLGLQGLSLDCKGVLNIGQPAHRTAGYDIRKLAHFVDAEALHHICMLNLTPFPGMLLYFCHSQSFASYPLQIVLAPATSQEDEPSK
jgi:hypothetical protein